MIGKIVGLNGSWGSGLATLTIETEEGTQCIFCDNAPAVRALDEAFPGFISEGHTFNNLAIKGKVIDYSTGFTGILEDFDIVEGE